MARWDRSRTPVDLDVVLGDRRGNGGRFLRALEAIGRRHGLDPAGVSSLVASDLEDGMEAEIGTPVGRLDVIGHGLAGVSRRAVLDGRQWWIVAGRPVAVCRFEHLLDIKAATGRAGDIADCRRLAELGPGSRVGRVRIRG